MSNGTCPKCGGADRKLLAPGYYECTSQVLQNVVPAHLAPGVAPAGVPIYGTCGFDYQEGSAPTSGPVCSCGVFAIGSCQTCGEPRCGRHGTNAGGAFICQAHIDEARAEAAAEKSRERERELTEAKAAVTEEARALRALLPGFPDAPATGSQLASALESLVPERKERFITERKSFGRKKSFAGWPFVVGRKADLEGGSRYHFTGLIVSTAGTVWEERGRWTLSGATSVSVRDWRPSFGLGNSRSQKPAVEGVELRRVAHQVLDWMGTPRPPGPSLEQRYLADIEGAVFIPTFAAWRNEQVMAE